MTDDQFNALEILKGVRKEIREIEKNPHDEFNQSEGFLRIKDLVECNADMTDKERITNALIYIERQIGKAEVAVQEQDSIGAKSVLGVLETIKDKLKGNG